MLTNTMKIVRSFMNKPVVVLMQLVGLTTLGILASSPANAAGLSGKNIELNYNFGNDSGTLNATVGNGAEFVLDAFPNRQDVNFELTIDFDDTGFTLSPSRLVFLGPSFPLVTDDFLNFSISGVQLTDVTLSNDGSVGAFEQLSFTGTSISLNEQPDNNQNLQSWSSDKVYSVTVEHEPVPEPLTILGSATAIGFGGLLKRQHKRKQQKS